MFNLHIAVKAQNGTIYEEMGNTDTTVLLPSLYDELAQKLQSSLGTAVTEVDPTDPEPKITLIRQINTYYSSLDEFAEALRFIEVDHTPTYA